MSDVSAVDSGQPEAGIASGTADPLNDALTSAFESINQDKGPAPGEQPVATRPSDDGTEEAASATTSKSETAEEAAQRVRDEKGRFAPKTAPADKAQPSEALSGAPAHWDAQKREAFGKLPPEAQKIVRDLTAAQEAGFTRKSQERANDLKFAESVRSMITDDHRAQLRRTGMDEIQGIKTLLNLQDMATRDAPGYARFFFQQSGLDPRQVFPELAGAAQPGQRQPTQPAQQPHPLERTVRELNDRFNGLTGWFRSQEETKAQSVIDRFRDAKDDAGNAKHPHFDRVTRPIEHILKTDPDIMGITDQTERLVKAYELAVLRDPELREEHLDGELRRREADRNRQADVEKAKRAKPAVRGTPAPVGGNAKATNLDDALRSAASAIGL